MALHPLRRHHGERAVTVEERHRQVFKEYEVSMTAFTRLQLELVDAEVPAGAGGLRRMPVPPGSRLLNSGDGVDGGRQGEPSPGASASSADDHTGAVGAATSSLTGAPAAAAQEAWHELQALGFARLGRVEPSDDPIPDEVQGRLHWPFAPVEVAGGELADGVLVTLRGDLAITASMQSAPVVLGELFQLGRAGEMVPPASHLLIYFGARPPVALEQWDRADGRVESRLVWVERALAHLGLWCGLPPAVLDEHVDFPTMPPPPEGVPSHLPVLEARQRWTAASEVRAAKAVGDGVVVSSLIIGAGPDGFWVADGEESTAHWSDPITVGNRINDLLRPLGASNTLN